MAPSPQGRNTMKLTDTECEFLYRHLINYRTPSSMDSNTANNILDKISKTTHPFNSMGEKKVINNSSVIHLLNLAKLAARENPRAAIQYIEEGIERYKFEHSGDR